jgi:N-formylglutamate amidohydrolase
MAVDRIWELTTGQGCLVAAAIHDGHAVREEVEHLLVLSEEQRLREEDPFTASWTQLSGIRVVGLRSRFEVDLNRPRNQAVYITPEDSWGLKTWESPPEPDFLGRSLAEYDAFYNAMYRLMKDLEERCGRFLVFDLHSYNHRRNGPDRSPADPAENPDINVGTGTMERKRWAPILDRFTRDLRTFDFLGRRLDVRENVRFKGGNFARWIHQTFPVTGCALAIEVKKFFMDEWTGVPDQRQLDAVREALEATVPGVLEELRKLGRREN